MRTYVLGLVGAAAVAACGRDPSCLRGDCATPCAELAFACDGAAMWIGRAGDAPPALRLRFGQAGDDDVLLSNGTVAAVISAIDAPIDLGPTGGNLVDLGPVGGGDDLTIVYQLAGILPEDAFAYRTLELVDDGAAGASVIARGTLDGRPEVAVVTQYAMTPCDPGLRVRSELWNGSAMRQAFMIADGTHWGKRRTAPLVPVAGQGFVTPELDLIALADQWSPYPYVGAAAPAADAPGYGVVACGAASIHGVNDLELSALGTPMTAVAPGDTLVLERFLSAAGDGDGAAAAIAPLLAARAQLLGAPAPVTVRGRVVAGGAGFGGDVRRASVLVLAGDAATRRVVTAVTPAADGTFVAAAPGDAALAVEVWSFGRAVASATVDAGGAVGDVAVPEPARLQVAVTRTGDDAPLLALVALDPLDDATRADVTGTFHGVFEACAPWLGAPHGASPACNRALVDPAGTELEVPAGRYRVVATAGPEHTLAAAEVTLVAGEIEVVDLALTPLAVRPAGWLSADLHVHGRASFDSGVPDHDRVRSFVAAGVDVIAATDHDVIGDYAATVAALGLGDRVAVMGGLEATQIIPWLEVPGEELPTVIGHFNFWPLAQVPGAPRAGAPHDEGIEPGALFDRMAPLVGPGGVMMMNHPWDEPFFGRDLGYLRAIQFDPRRPIVPGDPWNGALLRRPGGGRRNADWSAIEILNGADAAELQKARVLWFALLAQGLVTPGTGNSDSHGLSDAQLGWARNWVDAGTTVVGFDEDAFNDAVRGGRLIAGNGVVVEVTVGPAAGPRRGVGLAPHAAQAGDVVAVTVRAAPWVPVEELRVVTSRGERVLASRDELVVPTDPFGTAGVVRFEGTFALAELVEGDDFVVIEAGLAYPLVADLDDDGVPDTSDNDGDGDVDQDDVEPNEDAGPLTPVADPRDVDDPRFWLTRVVPGAWPRGFANPLLIDVDGDGWTAPGLREVAP